jgi:hypothetical protein
MECRLAGETAVLGENLPQHHFCPSQNPKWPDPGLNPGCHDGKPATNRLSSGLVCQPLDYQHLLVLEVILKFGDFFPLIVGNWCLVFLVMFTTVHQSIPGVHSIWLSIPRQEGTRDSYGLGAGGGGRGKVAAAWSWPLPPIRLHGALLKYRDVAFYWQEIICKGSNTKITTIKIKTSHHNNLF